VGAVDVVLADPQRVGAADARRLAARARERGTVLVQIAASGQRAGRGTGSRAGRGSGLEVDLRLTVTGTEWWGLGQGHGHLQSRRVVVEATGRRRAARARQVELWLPDGRGRILDAGREPARPARLGSVGSDLSPAAAGSRAYAGADVDRLLEPVRSPAPVRSDDPVELPGAS